MSPRSAKSRRPLTRRGFLGASVVAGAGIVQGAPAILGSLDQNEKLDLAIIGVGGRGGANLKGVSSENIVALCDVDLDALERVGKQYPRARQYRDFRNLFERANEIDGVVISTCEHTHAFATLPALQLGKHVYCEKPLTHGIHEARVIRDAARRARVATQMGTQIHAGDNYRRVVELIQGGVIGPVHRVHVWVGRAWGHQSAEEAKRARDIVHVTDRPAKAEPVPKRLDWDLWLGPAPRRPFHSVYVPGPKWYRWWDFGNGTMSDLGSHWVDLPWWALHLNHPRTIEASGPPPHPEIAPASFHVKYEYGPRGHRPGLELHWYQGLRRPEILGRDGIPDWPSGVLFEGEKGYVLSDYFKHVLLPEERFAGVARPPRAFPSSVGHHREWLLAAKTGIPTTCNFEYAADLTIANHLGNLAYRLGRKIEWDSRNLRAKNAPEAEALIRREYREGWSLT